MLKKYGILALLGAVAAYFISQNKPAAPIDKKLGMPDDIKEDFKGNNPKDLHALPLPPKPTVTGVVKPLPPTSKGAGFSILKSLPKLPITYTPNAKTVYPTRPKTSPTPPSPKPKAVAKDSKSYPD